MDGQSEILYHRILHLSRCIDPDLNFYGKLVYFEEFIERVFVLDFTV